MRSVLFVAIALPVLGLLRSVAAETAGDAETYEQLYYVPPPAWLPVLSLGHREALADLLWCRSLVYLGEEFAHRSHSAFVFDYAEAMLTLDPDFTAVYHWIATAGVYRADDVTPEDIRRSVAFLERGRERFPRDGQLAWELGATYSFELAPRLPPGDDRDEVRLRGAESLLDASRLGAAPDWLVLSTSSQLATMGSAELAAQALEEMYATLSDDAVRAEVGERIASLRSDAYGAAFAEANDELELQRIRTFPYVHPSLFFLLVAGRDEDEPPPEGYGRALIDSISPPEPIP